MFRLPVLVFFSIISYVLSGANDFHFNDAITDFITGDVFFEIIDPPELSYTYRLRPAKDFGATFNESVRFDKIRMVLSEPLYACDKLINKDIVKGNILLAVRGECSFIHKTLRAEHAGAKAVIITEHVENNSDVVDTLIEMVDDNSQLDVSIPSGFLVGRSGATILTILRKLNRKYAIINLPVNMTYVPSSSMKQPPWIGW